MSDIDELDRLYQETKRKTWTFDRSVNEIDCKDVRSVFKVAARYEAEAAARYAVAVANAWPGISARLRAAEAEVERLRGALRSVRDNYDCDEDAHRYGTICRRCDARAALGEP